MNGAGSAADIASLRDLAADLAQHAGTRARDGRNTDRRSPGHTTTHGTKSSATDLVTEHDRATERFLIDSIKHVRPDDGIVGEEGGTEAGHSGYDWYLDPIDGTTNFVYGFPMWATSVAVGNSDGMVAGAVYAPDLDELFAAGRGLGATLNGEPIVDSGADDLSLALVATGFAYASSGRVTQARSLVTIIEHVRDVRRGGSAALDLCYVAAGRLDGYYEQSLNLWDTAAGELIAREAGCVAASIGGGAFRPDEAIVAAPGVFDDLQELVQRSIAGARERP